MRGVVAVAEGGEQVFGLGPGGAVGDFLAEVVALVELLPDGPNYVVGVAVVLGEDDGLGDVLAMGEDVGEQLVAEGLDDGANLVDGHHVAVQLVGGVGEILLQLLPAGRSGLTVTLVDPVAGVHLVALLGDFGVYAVDVEVDVDLVGDRLPVAVLHDKVLLEEAEGLLGGGGGEADEEGVEVIEDLAPLVVDGAVAFVGDDEVAGLDGDVGVVLHPKGWFPLDRGCIEAGEFFQLRVQFLALEDGEEPLDRGDADLAHGVDGLGLEGLDVVELGELASLVGGCEALELLLGLEPQVAPVD